MTLTKEQIITTLNTRDDEFLQHYVGRALVAIFDRQTFDEQTACDTRYQNGKGFCGSDGRAGALSAKFYLKHRRLEKWQLAKWKAPVRGTPRIARYWKQLAEVAEQKKKAG